LCATAFLLPVANASKKAPAGKKAQVSASKPKPAAKSSAKASARSGTKAGAKAKPSGKVAAKRQVKADKGDRVVSGGRNVVASIRKRGGKTVVAVERRSVVRVPEAQVRRSFGQLAGLHSTQDPLDLNSSVALVIDQDTHEVLFSKNDDAVLPIASLTKLMTG